MPISPDMCPNKADHHPAPDPTTMRPKICLGCRRFLIWVPWDQPSRSEPEPEPEPLPVPTVDYDPRSLPERFTEPGPPVVAIDPDLMTAAQIQQAVRGEVVYVPLEPDQMT